jgi:N-glycosidase YbiA
VTWLFRRSSNSAEIVSPLHCGAARSEDKLPVSRQTLQNMTPEATEEPIVPRDGRILFFRRDRATFGFLSHFHRATIHLDSQDWPTVEHYFQAQRSDDPVYRHAIRNAVSPGIAKRLGASPDSPRRVSQQSWFRKNAAQPRADWERIQLDVMRRGDWAKFSQHPDLARRLLTTRPATIEEDAPFDLFWGTGIDGQGLNWAGRILMEIRDRLATAD